MELVWRVKRILLHTLSILGIILPMTWSSKDNCQLPADWSGLWFQNRVENLIVINTTHIETKGECVQSDGSEKFIFEDKLEGCYRCVVLHQKHHNVLQYKETDCNIASELDDLCDEIIGDAPLYSMFRVDGSPETCPFKSPPFTFSYNRGSGECKFPISTIDSCTDDSRLLFRYQACPDIQGTESTVEELLCLASWKDGNDRFLVGKVYHKMATTDEQRYRCFAYKEIDGSLAYQVAQSGESTCTNGLSAIEGSRTMKLSRVDSQQTSCKFPNWVSNHRRWHTLDYKRLYFVSHHNTSLRVSGDEQDQERRVICHTLVASSHHSVTIVAHATAACNSGYVCMMIYRRDGHVIELQQSGKVVLVPEEACNETNFNAVTLPYTTLITASLHSRKCPYLGRYTVSGQKIDGTRRKRQQGDVEAEKCDDEVFESLVVGCTQSSDTMQFYSACASETISVAWGWKGGMSILLGDVPSTIFDGCRTARSPLIRLGLAGLSRSRTPVVIEICLTSSSVTYTSRHVLMVDIVLHAGRQDSRSLVVE
uniref:Uncharacterized protein n=1 Tax=Timema genevievae TaxID=629358 RepID=A0A7R9JWL5_TIMGE|nr:unnamed protein product [Timema genevievae]